MIRRDSSKSRMQANFQVSKRLWPKCFSNVQPTANAAQKMSMIIYNEMNASSAKPTRASPWSLSVRRGRFLRGLVRHKLGHDFVCILPDILEALHYTWHLDIDLHRPRQVLLSRGLGYPFTKPIQSMLSQCLFERDPHSARAPGANHPFIWQELVH